MRRWVFPCENRGMVGIDGAFEREPCASDRAELIHLVPDGNIDLVSQTDRFDGWVSPWRKLALARPTYWSRDATLTSAHCHPPPNLISRPSHIALHLQKPRNHMNACPSHPRHLLRRYHRRGSKIRKHGDWPREALVACRSL